MPSHPWRFPATLLAVGLLSPVVFAPAPARADVGVERASRSVGAPGGEITLVLGCGFCYPPCYGPLGDRNDTCTPDTKAPPPASFPVSLVPIEKVPRPRRCGPNAICPPRAPGPPRRFPFAFLGWAAPAGNGDGGVPRYLLRFEIPDLRPGVYVFVVYCDACLPGKLGSLIADPGARASRLHISAGVHRQRALPGG